jgi:hypothetical protein
MNYVRDLRKLVGHAPLKAMGTGAAVFFVGKMTRVPVLMVSVIISDYFKFSIYSYLNRINHATIKDRKLKRGWSYEEYRTVY